MEPRAKIMKKSHQEREIYVGQTPPPGYEQVLQVSVPNAKQVGHHGVGRWKIGGETHK